MKRFISICSLILALAVLGSITAYSADSSYFTLNGFTFTINDSEAIIYRYEGSETEVEIPDKLLGYNVTAIDNYAFLNNSAITSVSFEKSKNLRKIGVSAFYGCTNLTEIELPQSLTEISFGVFQGCSKLEKVSFNNGVTTIPAQCFYQCEKLNNVELPDNLVVLSDRSFSLCPSLEFLELPDSLISIADNAFENSGAVEVYCNEGSYAQEFAKEKGMSYAFIYDFALGDANLDGKTDINDVTAIQMHIAQINALPRYQGKTFADVYKDGKITIRDATYIQLKLAGRLDF